jgi:hypothetical protein
VSRLDREWWAVEAVHAGTDWSGLVAAALEMMVAAGIVEEPAAQAMTPWDAPSWREAAAKYHEDHPDTAIPAERLARLRRLMADDVSLGRACHEIGRNRQAPQQTIEALMLGLRSRGVNALNEAAVRQRLLALNDQQLNDVCRRLQRLKPEIAKPWGDEETQTLLTIQEGLRHGD